MIPRAIVLLALPALTFAGIDDDLAQAAKSPYDLQRFVQTHTTFNWEPLSQALGIQGKLSLVPCKLDVLRNPSCSARSITIPDPSQAIVVLYAPLGPHVFLHYRNRSTQQAADSWQFAGYYASMSKDPKPAHRILQFGIKPFLLVTQKALAGSNVWIATEDWIDLTTPKVELVLKLKTGVELSVIPDYVETASQASVLSLQTEPVEAVTVGYQTWLTHNGNFLAARSDTVTYIRQGTTFVFDATQSTRPKKEIDALYDIQSAPPEDYLRYLLPEFNQIATGPNGEMKSWLKRLLAASGDTPEKRELQALLPAK